MVYPIPNEQARLLVMEKAPHYELAVEEENNLFDITYYLHG
ncbi:hypothetical protein MKX29_04610 [Cytobacillus sp. FSL R7-0696]